MWWTWKKSTLIISFLCEDSKKILTNFIENNNHHMKQMLRHAMKESEKENLFVVTVSQMVVQYIEVIYGKGNWTN